MDENKNYSDEEAKRILAEKEGEAPADEPKDLGKVVVNQEILEKREAVSELHQKFGDKEFFIKNLPSKGLFYPEGLKLFIRSARADEIKYFSTMDEQDLVDIEDKLNMIVNKCLRIVNASGKPFIYKDILEEDRIKLILAIKDLTFMQGENKIILDMPCPKCQHENKVELSNDVLSVQDLHTDIEKYYDPEERQFVFRTKSHGEIRMTPPSIGIMQVVYDYVRKKQEQGKKWDKAFMQLYPYIKTDWRGIVIDEDRGKDDVLNDNVEFAGWSSEKYSLVYKLAEKMKIGIKTDLEIECENCGHHVTAPIKFENGLKELFIKSDIDDELL